MPQLRHFRVIFMRGPIVVSVEVSVGDAEGPPELVARKVLLAFGITIPEGSGWSASVNEL
jgi:hypothetical protein